jgi:peroxiredoxin
VITTFENSHRLPSRPQTQSLTPRNIVKLRYKIAHQRRNGVEGQGFYADSEFTDSDAEPAIPMESSSRKKVSSSEDTLSDSLESVESDALSTPDTSDYMNDVDLHVGRAIPDMKHNVVRRYDTKFDPNTLLRTGMVVLTFIRQFGCPACRKHLNTLAQLSPYLERMDVKVVAIGTGKSKFAESVCKISGYNQPIYRDKAAKLFKAFGCLRGFGPSFNSKSLGALRTAQSEGYKSGSMEGHAFQMGGTFVLYNGEIIFEKIERFIGDFPDYKEMLKVCGVPSEELQNVHISRPIDQAVEKPRGEFGDRADVPVCHSTQSHW